MISQMLHKPQVNVQNNNVLVLADQLQEAYGPPRLVEPGNGDVS